MDLAVKYLYNLLSKQNITILGEVLVHDGLYVNPFGIITLTGNRRVLELTDRDKRVKEDWRVAAETRKAWKGDICLTESSGISTQRVSDSLDSIS